MQKALDIAQANLRLQRANAQRRPVVSEFVKQPRIVKPKLKRLPAQPDEAAPPDNEAEGQE